MKVDCYLSLGCASEDALKAVLYEALDLEAVKADVKFHRITDKEAAELGLKGSPSVLIDGKDIEPADMQGFSGVPKFRDIVRAFATSRSYFLEGGSQLKTFKEATGKDIYQPILIARNSSGVRTGRISTLKSDLFLVMRHSDFA